MKSEPGWLTVSYFLSSFHGIDSALKKALLTLLQTQA